MGFGRRAFRFGSTALACALACGACANVVGLDGLVYDREGSGGGVTGGTTSTGVGDGGASGSTVGTTGASPSQTSTATGEGASTSSGTGGSTGFVVSGTSDGYLDLIEYYDTPFWRFAEAGGASTAIDSGLYNKGGAETPSDWDGNYLSGGGTITLGVTGVFGDDTAVTFAGGARIEVPRQDPIPYAFEFPEDQGSFTITFFAKLDATPAAPLTVASCFDAGAQLGWRLLVGSDVVLERYGLDESANLTSDSSPPMPFPADGAFHLVTFEKASGAGPMIGYLDGERRVEPYFPTVQQMLVNDCVLSLGADPLADASTPAITLDELAIVPYGLNDDQLAAQITCLQGGSCNPPGL